MIKYVVCCGDKIIGRGEFGYYDDFRDLVPHGFRYVWAFKSPELLTINVEPGIQCRYVAGGVKKVVGMSTWGKDKIEPYRMEM